MGDLSFFNDSLINKWNKKPDRSKANKPIWLFNTPRKTMNISKLYHIFKTHPHICTDSRTVAKNTIFFALKGESFDGNIFASEAIQKGASFAIVDNPVYAVSDRYILVDDALTVLQNLATFHRNTFNIPIIGVTGSNGKTTTKELLAQALSKKFVVHATQGNFNNHIGVPLTLLAMPANTEIAVIEMGANKPGDIRQLSEIALPTYGIITNVGKAHLEGFGSFEGVVKTKTELYQAISRCNGNLFVDADNPILMQHSQNVSRILYGTRREAHYRGMIDSEFPQLTIKYCENGMAYTLKTHLTGSYNIQNVMAALAAGRHFGVAANDITDAIAGYEPSNHRSQIVVKDRNILILDAYNANPTSMVAALENLLRYPASSKCAIIGDMFELGEYARNEHHQILELALSYNFGMVVAIGPLFGIFKDKFPFSFFSNTSDFASYLKQHPVSDHVVLLKGSRKMGLEALTGYL